jgi:cobalamin biosynthesis Mg chelatase CobN
MSCETCKKNKSCGDKESVNYCGCNNYDGFSIFGYDISATKKQREEKERAKSEPKEKRKINVERVKKTGEDLKQAKDFLSGLGIGRKKDEAQSIEEYTQPTEEKKSYTIYIIIAVVLIVVAVGSYYLIKKK